MGRTLAAAMAATLLGFSPLTQAQSAKACFNERLIQQGTTVEQRIRNTDRLTGEKLAFDVAFVVVGRENFKGKDALLIETELDSSQLGISSNTQIKNYVSVQKAKARIRDFGSMITDFVDGVDQGEAEVVHEPPRLQRFDLNKGQRYTQKLRSTTTLRSVFGSVSEVLDLRITQIYQGRQTIKTPLGRREACKFRVIERLTQLGVTTKEVWTEWYDVKSGLVLKQKSELGTTVLVRARIDGAKI